MTPYEDPRWKPIRRAVLARDGHQCQLHLPGCRHRADTVDHITDWRDGGSWFGAENLRTACRPCNAGQRNVRVAARARAQRDEAAKPAQPPDWPPQAPGGGRGVAGGRRRPARLPPMVRARAVRRLAGSGPAAEVVTTAGGPHGPATPSGGRIVPSAAFFLTASFREYPPDRLTQGVHPMAEIRNVPICSNVKSAAVVEVEAGGSPRPGASGFRAVPHPHGDRADYRNVFGANPERTPH